MKCGAASSGVILAPRLGEDGAEGLSSNGHVSIGQTAERRPTSAATSMAEGDASL